MSYALGVDIGTSYTAAAVWRDGRASTVTLADRADSIPSAVFLRPDGSLLIGDVAVRRGVLEPDRLARGFKRALADTVPLLLGTDSITRTELTGQLLRFVLQKVIAREGSPPAAVTLTVPAEWGDHHRDLMVQVAAEAGLTDVGLLPEPVAVAIHYAAQQRFDLGTVVAVYDFGGGTFDTALVERTADGFELRGRPGGDAALGGEDFDDVVMNHVRRSLGNALALLDMSDDATVAGLQQVRQNAIAAKEALSADVDASIAVILPGITRDVRLTRAEFQTAIRIPLLRTLDALERTMTAAGVTPADLHAVLLAGGSSRIPLVSELLNSELGVAVVTDAHPKYAVCLGAALTAAGRLEAAAALVATPLTPVVAAEGFAPAPVSDTEALVVAPEVVLTATPGDIGLAHQPEIAVRVGPGLRRTLRYLSDRDELAVEHHTDTRRGGRALLVAVAVVALAVAAVVLVATQGWLDPERPVAATTVAPSAPTTTEPEVASGPAVTLTPLGLPSAAGERATGATAVGTGVVVVGAVDQPTGAKVWRWDGATWTALESPPVGPGRVGLIGAVAGSGPVVAAGWSAEPATAAEAGRRRGEIWVSADGSRFVQATVPEVGELTGITRSADGGWLAVGRSWADDPTDGDAVVLTSPDAAVWSVVPAVGLSGPGRFDLGAPLAEPAGGIVALGARMEGALTTTHLWRSSDGGVSWTRGEDLPVAGPGAGDASTLLVDATGALIAVGYRTGITGASEPVVWRTENGFLTPHPVSDGQGVELIGAAFGSTGLVVVGRRDGAAAAWTVGGL